MSMTENMARVERMALRGVSIDQIMALGLPLSPRTVASIVDMVQAPQPKPALEVNVWKQAFANAAAEYRRQAPTRYRVIAVRGGDLSVAQIIEDTARKHGLSAHELTSAGRTGYLIPARHEAMYRCIAETKNSYPVVAKAFNRDHTTVMHGVRKHAERNGLPLPRGMKPEGAV